MATDTLFSPLWLLGAIKQLPDESDCDHDAVFVNLCNACVEDCADDPFWGSLRELRDIYPLIFTGVDISRINILLDRYDEYVPLGERYFNYAGIFVQLYEIGHTTICCASGDECGHCPLGEGDHYCCEHPLYIDIKGIYEEYHLEIDRIRESLPLSRNIRRLDRNNVEYWLL